MFMSQVSIGDMRKQFHHCLVKTEIVVFNKQCLLQGRKGCQYGSSSGARGPFAG